MPIRLRLDAPSALAYGSDVLGRALPRRSPDLTGTKRTADELSLCFIGQTD